MHTAVSVDTFFPRMSFVSLLERIMEVTTLNIIRSFTLRFKIQRRIISHEVEEIEDPKSYKYTYYHI